MLSMNYPLIRVQEIAGGTPGTKGRRSGSRYALRFAMALLPMARRLPMSTRFKRLWTLGLLGAWLSIFAGNAFAACSVLLGGTGTDGTVSTKGCYTTYPSPPPDAPPAVSITSPANNASFATSANVSVTASATDSDGYVAKVYFFDGGTLVGTATVAPYSVALTNLATGTHTLTARATDNVGLSTTSAAVSIIIIVDTPPTVTITGPANNAVFIAPANITVTATAGDADGNVAKVDFFDGATLVGTATAAPFGVTLANVAAGAHTLTAIATDNLGLSTTSAGVSIQVDGPAELLWTDVASDLVAVNRGATGDMWIANVDMARLPQVKLQDSQPYWFKYLRSFWTSTGVYVGSGCPAIWYPSLSEATDTRYPYRIQAVDVNGVKIGLMHLGGPQGQITSRAAALTSTDPYISPPQAEFQ